MSNSSAPHQIDYNQVAADFDRFLPLIQPVTQAILDHLPVPVPGATVLDVACGTGEPGLTLARRAPEVHLLGVDSADAMIAIARAKAAREELPNARFAVMPFEKLDVADASVDGVISRFGLIMFGDVPKSAHELARVLRSSGDFSLAVWDDMAKNTLVHSLFTALRDHLPKEHFQLFEQMNAWAVEGRRIQLLQDAGLGAVKSEMFSWNYHFTSFDEAWTLLNVPVMFGRQLSALSPEAQQQAKLDLTTALSAYRQSSGEYFIPHTCRLIWGQR